MAERPATAARQTLLSWHRFDPEERIGFRGGQFTRVNTWCSLLIGVVLTIAFYATLIPLNRTYFASMFTERGFIPYFIVGFFFWSLAILGLKFLKLRLQRRALECEVVPHNPDYVLSPATVKDVNQLIDESAEDPKRFLLLNRISVAVSNLGNLGRVADVDDILRSQASHDDSAMETSYLLVQGFVWAIPVLGFIGTVLGLSQAIGGFGDVLTASSELGQIKDSLREVTGGLAVAFETTLQGLVAAVLVQLLLTALKKSEEEFLDACSEYCVRHIVGRLRLNPFEMERE